METSEKRKMNKAVRELLDLASDDLSGGQRFLKPVKLVGEGWQAYVYAPAGPGSAALHVEIRLDSLPGFKPAKAA